MKTWLSFALALLGMVCIAAETRPAAAQADPAEAIPPQQDTTSSDTDRQAEIYYNLTMGHLYRQRYQATNRGKDANLAIEYYRKAYEMDPSSGVLGENLAEMYLLSQRIRDAVVEAREVVRRDPTNLPARRLLARIYIRALGNLPLNSAGQQDAVGLATEQLREIVVLDPSDAQSALWLARLERLMNRHDEAERVLRDLLARQPGNEDAVEQLARLLLDQNRTTEAVTLLQEALTRLPSADLFDMLGDAHAQQGDAAGAENAYQNAVDLEPRRASYRRGLAQALFDQEKYPEALNAYIRLVEIDPDDATNYLRLSQIYRRLQQLDEAERQVLLAKERAPGSLEILYSEAAIYEAQGRYEDAIRVLSEAIARVESQEEFVPSRRRTLAILYQLLGQIYRDVDDVDSAVRTFGEMRALGPEEDRRARLLIMETHREARDLPRAFEAARQALEEYPGDRSLQVAHAMLLGENAQAEEAAALLRSLLDDTGADLEIHLSLAQVYQQSLQYAQAEAAVRSAERIATRPEQREATGLMLGAIYEKQGRIAEAEQAFQSVLSINPRNAPALNYYGYMLADRGVRLDEAVSLVQRALDEDPSNGAYLDSMGWAYYKQGKLAAAEMCVRRALERERHDPTILSHLGDILAQSGRLEQAAVQWERSLAEWHRVSPVHFEADKVAEVEQKLAGVRNRMAQQNATPAGTPQ